MITEEFVKKMISGINTLKVKLYQDQDEYDFAIWPPSKIDELNSGYEVKEYLPGYLAIGSDGGLEMLTVHLQSEKVYSIPFIPMEVGEQVLVADSLKELLKAKD
jgi:hypothetical protein